MRRNLPGIAFLAVCMLFCFAVGISALFSDGSAALEKRQIDEMPSFFYDDKTINKNFDSELSDWLSVRMPFRPFALRTKSEIMKTFFASSAEDDVIIGKNGWLYFTDTVDEYIGAHLLSERSILNIKDTLCQLQEYCLENSMDFVFTVAPNKNTLYPENMPSRFIKSETNNFTRLKEALAESGVNYVDLSDLNECAENPLYYATDTHWNAEGALIVYDRLLEAIGKEHASYAAVSYKQTEKAGDLTEMLFPGSELTETENAPDIEVHFSYTSRMRSEEDIRITTHNESGSGSLMMFRDSFGNALLPLFAENFENGYFSRAVPCDFSSAVKNGCDTVIYEIVQRNLENIVSYAPVMNAKRIEKPDNIHISENTDAVVVRTETDGMLHIYGTVDSGYLENNSDITLRLETSSGEELFFRCFRIYEKGLFEDDVCRDNGFSVYLDPNDLPDEKMTVSVMVQNKNENMLFSADHAIEKE